MLSPMLPADSDTSTEEEDIDVYNDTYDDMHTEMNMTTPAYITTDAVYMYNCTPEGRSNSPRTREPDGIRVPVTDVTGSYPLFMAQVASLLVIK